ncbi:MAG: arginine--tRNA ligase, partial [Gemmatimonadales bacterium]
EGVARCRNLALNAMREDQDSDLRTFGVHMDLVFSESDLYRRREVEAALERLAAKNLTYEADGALWLRSEQFGDDKDRVLRKQDGSYTYLVPDIAYHVDKRDRGFDQLINVWGADHHGYIPRMNAVMAALGYEKGFLEIAIVQLVKVVRGGQEVKMSKRSGEFVTLRDLFLEVGVDAARYFFLMRRADSHLVFDVDLARSQTEENPVFYVQMAHARMSGIFRVAQVEPESITGDVDLAALTAPEDTELLKMLTTFPEIVEAAARNREPHRITGYLEDLARMTHGWYHRCRVLGEPPATERARLALARAARVVLANALTLLGLSAPDRM